MPTATGPGPTIPYAGGWNGRFLCLEGTASAPVWAFSTDGKKFTTLAHPIDPALFPSAATDYPNPGGSGSLTLGQVGGQPFASIYSNYYAATFTVQMNAAANWTDGQTPSITTYPANFNYIPLGDVLFGSAVFGGYGKVVVATATTRFSGSATSPATASVVLGVCGVAGSYTYIALYAGSTTYYTSTDGLNWTTRTAAAAFASGYAFVGTSQGRAVFRIASGNGTGANLVFSTADGITFTAATIPTTSSFSGYNITGVATPNTVLIAGGRVFRSTDGGLTFSGPLSVPSAGTFAVTFVKLGKAIIVQQSSYGLGATFDDGLTYQAWTAPQTDITITSPSWSDGTTYFFRSTTANGIYSTTDFKTFSLYTVLSGDFLPKTRPVLFIPGSAVVPVVTYKGGYGVSVQAAVEVLYFAQVTGPTPVISKAKINQVALEILYKSPPYDPGGPGFS